MYGTDRDKVREILDSAKSLIKDREGHGDLTFEIMADLAAVYLGKPVKATDAAMLMVLFKIARIIAGQPNYDNYVDAINYLAFALERNEIMNVNLVPKEKPNPAMPLESIPGDADMKPVYDKEPKQEILF